ncbi:MAG: hypothetical protein IJ882_00855 [Paludibacteraceae bacterium]|nr:hypothetical protein [Paludibacteraceae bacterium]
MVNDKMVNDQMVNVEWLLAIAAYAYLAYRLATYDQYALVAESLRAMGAAQWLALGVCVALMPVNMLLEAWRWRTLWNDGVRDARMTLGEAQRQVYYSKLAGLVTPWRLGEYPARAVLMKDSTDGGTGSIMPKVLTLGAVGSATMTAAIIIAGVLALAFSPAVLEHLGGSYLYALGIVMALLCLALCFAPQWLKRYAELNNRLLLTSLAQSLVRLLCWCVQLALVLYALNACPSLSNFQLHSTLNYQLSTSFISQLSTFNFQLLPIYYLLVTVTPNIPIVEAGVRGAWAIFLFGTPSAALAGVLLWAVNTLLPCLAWLFIRKDK